MKGKWFLLFTVGWVLSVLTSCSVTKIGSPTHWTEIEISKDDPYNNGISCIEVFKGDLYASTFLENKGVHLWRLNSSEEWKLANEPGFGNNNIVFADDMIEFNKQLYVAAGGWKNESVGQIWRSPDGNSWEAVTRDGFGQPDAKMFNRFGVFKKMLYVANGSNLGVQIWRSSTGDPGSWEKVVDKGLGDIFTSGLNSFAEFKGSLYAVIESESKPSILWRTNDGANWEVIKRNGFGHPEPLPADYLLEESPGSLLVFQDHLYLGLMSYNALSVDQQNPQANTGPAQIWRTKDGLEWEPVMQGGFGDWRNRKVESLYEFQGQLYAGTMGINWINVMPDGGMQVWRSPDGVNWTICAEPGFGKAHNYVSHLGVAVAADKDSLYYATLNGLGGEVWRLTEQ
jgi:hypothetical protein